MNRANYFNYIEEKISVLAFRVEKRGKLNILDYHIHSENFYRDFLNLLYDWDLINLNQNQQNVEGIDLADNKNKIIIQVSAKNTKDKIDSSLEKQSLKNYKNYTFKFVSIARNAENLKNKTYSIPDYLVFNSQNDIYDIDTLLKKIKDLEIEKLEEIYNFIIKELGTTADIVKLKSGLTNIINILAKQNLSQNYTDSNLNSFEIERKIEFNKLDSSRLFIEDYKIHHKTVDNIYSSYDEMGQNKSLAVLNIFRKEYIDNMNKFEGDALYRAISNNIFKRIKNTNSIDNISEEELNLCVDILMVDAFIRCKILKNPSEYNYAFTR